MLEIMDGLRAILRTARPSEPEAEVGVFVDAFNSVEPENVKLWIERIRDDGNRARWPGLCRIISGHLSYTQRDHPLSPDGVAMLTIPFALLLLDDETYGERVFFDDGFRN
jgi:hypothetical protein